MIKHSFTVSKKVFYNAKRQQLFFLDGNAIKNNSGQTLLTINDTNVFSHDKVVVSFQNGNIINHLGQSIGFITGDGSIEENTFAAGGYLLCM